MKLDWQHVALSVVAAGCLAALLWFAVRSASPALMAVAVPATGLYLTQLMSMLKGSPLIGKGDQ